MYIHLFVAPAAPPSIVTPLPTDLSQTHMTNFTLVCSAVADLTAVIVWRYNGERDPPDADIVTNRTHSILEIKSLTGRNSGIYNCSASNRYGRDSTAVNLQVQGASMHVVCVCTYTKDCKVDVANVLRFTTHL